MKRNEIYKNEKNSNQIWLKDSSNNFYNAFSHLKNVATNAINIQNIYLLQQGNIKIPFANIILCFKRLSRKRNE